MNSHAMSPPPPPPVPLPGHGEVSPMADVRQRRWIPGLHSMPNIIVFALLGGVMYLGHHTGWKLPKISELTGGHAVEADDWCDEHLVPESACIECQPDLVPKPKPFGFCKEHGVAECVIHHPELAQSTGKLRMPSYDTVAAIALTARPENNSRNTMHTSRVQFASAESMAKAGVDVDVVQERPMREAVSANGELLFDPTRVAHLSSRAPGTIAAVFKTIGDRVAAGEILALVDASLVGQAKSQLLQAVVLQRLRVTTVERLRSLGSGGSVPQKAVIEAEAALQEADVGLISARQALTNLGFKLPPNLEANTPEMLANDLRFLDIPSPLMAALPANARTTNLMPIYATFDGTLIATEVVAGEVVDTSTVLFTVSDPTRMWLILNVRQEDAADIRTGLPVRFETDNGNRYVTGNVTWISPTVDPETRTLQVRVPIANTDGSLRDNTFGTGQIILREEARAITVPREAVQSTPDASFIFVRDKNFFSETSPKFFHVRQVRLGASDGPFVELLAGVLPGEVIASKGSNVLLAQLLRSNLGAGCGCHE